DPSDRNVISGHAGGTGVDISVSDVSVEGNYIGTDRSGSAALGNQVGIQITDGSGNFIGCEVIDGDNVISGNSDDGVRIATSDPNSAASDNFITGNFIGTKADGTSPLGNGGDGISLYDATDNAVGINPFDESFPNTIAFNTGAGVEVKSGSVSATATGNIIVTNSIHDNGGLGIDL